MTTIDRPVDATARRAAAVERRTKETSVEVRLDLDGTGTTDDRDGHRLLRPPPELARPPRAVRPRDPGRRRPPRRRAPHGRGRRARPGIGAGRGARRPGRDRSVRRRRVPMDESLATAVVDVGGRPYAVVELPFRAERAGGLPLAARRACPRGVRADGRRDPPHRRDRAQRSPPRRGSVQGTRPRAPGRLRARPAPRGRGIDEGHARMTRPVAVVDYGAGNLVSIDQALRHVGATPVPVIGASDLAGLDGLIVPGVGAAAPAMERLADQGLVDPIRRLDRGRPAVPRDLPRPPAPVRVERRGRRLTFGVLPGRTEQLANAPTLPHIGWNQVERTRRAPALRRASPTARTSTSFIPMPACCRPTPRTPSSAGRTTARRLRAPSPAGRCSACSSTPSEAAATACGSWRTSCRSSGRPRRRRWRPPLMLCRRVIPCLDVADGRVVKGTRFVDLVDEGDPPELAERYAAEGADEIVFLDISAAPEGRGDAPRHRRADRAAGVHPVDGRRRRPVGRRDADRTSGRRRQGLPQHGRRGATPISSAAVPRGSGARRSSSRSTRGRRPVPRRRWEVVVKGGREPTGHRRRRVGRQGGRPRRRRAARDVDRPRRHPERVRHGAPARDQRARPRPGHRVGGRGGTGGLRHGGSRGRRRCCARRLDLPPADPLDRRREGCDGGRGVARPPHAGRGVA